MTPDSTSSRQEGQSPVKTPQKRPRPVLSCIDCRRKKLKCDRSLPCTQCWKAGIALQCTYKKLEGSLSNAQAHNTDGSESDSVERARKTARIASKGCTPNQGSSSDLFKSQPSSKVRQPKNIGVVEDLQCRVAQLERLLLDRPHGLLVGPEGDGTHGQARGLISPGQAGFFCIDGQRSQFHGQGHKVALLREFEEAQGFIHKCSADVTIRSKMKQFHSLHKAFMRNPKAPKAGSLSVCSSTISSLSTLLPSRTVCDRLLKIYFDNFETNFRVLHAPTFMKEYNNFILDRDSSALPFVNFLPQLVTVLGISISLDESDAIGYDYDFEGIESATTSCGLVQAWLDSLDWKSRIQLSTLRTQTLLLLAQQTRSTRNDNLWSSTGALIRAAMTMGLHRDPKEIPEISVFEREQRRRLWMTIVELDLQTSLTSGMPTMVGEADFTCTPPANVDDSELFEGMTEPPTSRSPREWTDSLFQVILATSLPQRLRAIKLANNFDNKPGPTEALELGRLIENSLCGLPEVPSCGSVFTKEDQKPGRLFGRVMLDVYIQRALFCLYRPFILQASRSHLLPETRRVCVQYSLVVLCHQDFFDPEVADLDVVKSRKYWELFHMFCNNDIIQAAFTICLEIKRMSLAPLSGSRGSTSEDKALTWTKASLTRTVENVIDSLARLSYRSQSDLRDPLCLCLVLQSVRSNSSDERKEVMMREGATSLITSCQEHLSHGVRDANSSINRTTDTNMGFNISPTLQLNGVQEHASAPFADASNNTDDLSGLDSFSGTDANFGGIDFDFGFDWGLNQAWL
ncbi:MAG: hypothetical protein M1812_005215 [Candelaria pacifica]|nr:MAG: hypothetical protein M1812_005215 [Candelaria pacifica]